MKLLTDLFSTDYGLMSISGIVFMLGMGVFFVCFFKRKIAEDARAAGFEIASVSTRRRPLLAERAQMDVGAECGYCSINPFDATMNQDLPIAPTPPPSL